MHRCILAASNRIIFARMSAASLARPHPGKMQSSVNQDEVPATGSLVIDSGGRDLDSALDDDHELSDSIYDDPEEDDDNTLDDALFNEDEDGVMLSMNAFRALHKKTNELMDANDSLEDELRFKDQELEKLSLAATTSIENCRYEADHLADGFIAKMSEEVQARQRLERLVVKREYENTILNSQLTTENLRKCMDTRCSQEERHQHDSMVQALRTELAETRLELKQEKEMRRKELLAAQLTIEKIAEFIAKKKNEK